MKKYVVLFPMVLIFWTIGFSQEKSIEAFDKVYLNWYNSDLSDNGVLGAGVEKAYTELLSGKPVKKTVIVAVIDGGVDITIDDLKEKIWVNAKEIAGNGVDDDGNGYTDDLYGWNFIGNSKGENIVYENLEITRVYKTGGGNAQFLKAKALYDEEYKSKSEDKVLYDKFETIVKTYKSIIKTKTGVEVNGPEDLTKVKSDEPDVKEALKFLKERYDMGFTEKVLKDVQEYTNTYLDNYLNTAFNARSIVGDNPKDINDRNYGNPDVKGPRANHGTCVAGIIAGARNNGIGINGIATDVRIMVLRVVPDGDERDKDVALAIRYAVDNGADIINMSFGKDLSPEQQFVDDAIRYAEQHRVLMIHAAGNDGMNIDVNTDYPSDVYMDHSEASNFVNVGASGNEKSKTLACDFSNYGQAHVDLFAPGQNIVALDTSNYFNIYDGTSMAAPVVTGVAAVLLAYYPDLKPEDVISILLQSTTELKKMKVLIPDLESKKRATVKFGTLSKSGGIVNLYQALKIAEGYKP